MTLLFKKTFPFLIMKTTTLAGFDLMTHGPQADTIPQDHAARENCPFFPPKKIPFVLERHTITVS
jgi:hypothetical protein